MGRSLVSDVSLSYRDLELMLLDHGSRSTTQRSSVGSQAYAEELEKRIRRLCCKDDRRRWEDGDKRDPISFMRRYRKER